MKKLLFFMAAVALLASCGNSNKYSVTMTLPSSDLAGSTAYLIDIDSEDTVATATVADSVVKFEGTTDKAFLAGVKVGFGSAMIVVEPGEINVDATGKAAGTELNKSLEALVDSLQSAQSQEDLAAILKSAYETNKDNPIGIFAFLNYVQVAEIGLADVEAELASAPVIAASKQMTKMLESLRSVENTTEGKMFTDFTVTGDDGKEQHLSDYVGKGDYVLADFWASWCGPCRMELPNIKKIYDKYNGKGLTVIGIAVWDKPEDTRKAIEEEQIPWPQILNAGHVPTDIYGIQGIPHIILFGPDGTIIARNLRGDDMAAKVDEVMKKK